MLNKTNKFWAFTLAETLITLTMIGIVSVLVIPTFAAKYKEHVRYAQFTKAYSTISDVVKTTVMYNKAPSRWGNPGADEEFARKYFGPYLKIMYDCGNDFRDVRCNQGAVLHKQGKKNPYNPGTLKGTYSNSFRTYGNGREWYVRLQDGSSLVIMPYLDNSGNLEYIWIFADIDGPDKGDYTGGSDLFKFSVKRNGKLYLKTSVEYCDDNGLTSCSWGCRSDLDKGPNAGQTCGEYYKKNCIEYGSNCAYVMLRDKKIKP